jgi:hypothetical protein
MPARMPNISSGDLSLINGNSFHDELDRRGEIAVSDGSNDPQRTTFSDAFDVLECGLPVTSSEPDFGDWNPEHELIRFPREAAATPPPRPAKELRVPFFAAAVVIGFCVAIGGAMAALVFHERVMNITVSRTAASR